jgi:hypothetical protein
MLTPSLDTSTHPIAYVSYTSSRIDIIVCDTKSDFAFTQLDTLMIGTQYVMIHDLTIHDFVCVSEICSG